MKHTVSITIVALVALAGGIVLLALSKDVPAWLVGVITAAVGALAGIAQPSSSATSLAATDLAPAPAVTVEATVTPAKKSPAKTTAKKSPAKTTAKKTPAKASS